MMSTSVTTIHFVRHGSVYNPHDIFYGRLPRFRLSAEGLRQAHAAAHYFAGKPIGAVYSSPMLRARQTAHVIAAFLGQPGVKVSSYLNEVRTPFDGNPTRDIDARNWDIYSGMETPYEQPGDIFNRVLIFMHKIQDHYNGQQVIAVTHADVIVFTTLWANGYAVTYKNKSLIEHKQIPIQFPSPASVTSLTWEPGQEHPVFAFYGGHE